MWPTRLRWAMILVDDFINSQKDRGAEYLGNSNVNVPYFS